MEKQANAYYYQSMFDTQASDTVGTVDRAPAGDPGFDLRHLLSARRAIRDFSSRTLDRALLERIVLASGDAPSSQGVQPYEVHLVVEPELRARLARACNEQRGARSAQALAVFVVGPAITRRRIEESRAYYQTAPLPERSRAYHLGSLNLLAKAHNPWLLPLLGVARWALSIVQPSRSMLPLGSQGVRDWAARNAMLGAQSLLLAAGAHGVDSCPMEGFNGARVAEALGLAWGSAPILVVALGYRADDARVEPRWRRTAAQMVVTH